MTRCGCLIKVILISQILILSAYADPARQRIAKRALSTTRAPGRPRIRGLSPEPITLIEGEDSEILPCEVSNRGESWLHWYKDGQRINMNNMSYQVVKMGLKIKNVKKEAAGMYKCVLSDDGELIQEKFIPLDVEDAPPDIHRATGPIRWVQTDDGIEDETTTIGCAVNEDVPFKCAVYGEAEINADWYINDQLPNDPNGPNSYSNDKLKIKFPLKNDKRRTTLTWKNAQLGDNGSKFTCRFTQNSTNSGSQTIERNFILDVREEGVIPPTIVNDNAKPLVAYIGENFTYECRLLKPKEQNRHVYFGWARYYGVKEANELIISDWQQGSVLNLTNITVEDEGQYICFVSNQKKRDSKVFNLTVQSQSQNNFFGNGGDPGHFAGGEIIRNPENSLLSSPLSIIISITVGVVFVVVVFAVVITVMKRKKPSKHPKKRIILLAPTETYHDFSKDSLSDLAEPLMAPMVQIQGGRNRLSSEICSYSDYEFPLDEKWEIRPRNRVQMMHLLGEGAFGCVYYAELKPPVSDDSSLVTPIAVKMLKADATDKELIDLVQELEVMKRFGQHKNIINLIGCMTRDGPLYVIVEYAQHGNLRDFLRNNRPAYSYGSGILNPPVFNDLQLTQKHLVTFAYQIANGMHYLASNQCLHRDLAARNVLVGEDYEMKIADFGLSRNLVQSDYYKKVTEGKLPIKWMAPEALIDKKYTTKSDVWSYGVLLWEVFTLGGNPYPTVPHERLFEALREGHRMDKPTYSTVDVYAIMRQCWQYHSAQRPTFAEILDDLSEIVEKTENEVLDFDCSPVTTPRESTTSPHTSTTSFSCDEHNIPELPAPPELPSLPPSIMV